MARSVFLTACAALIAVLPGTSGCSKRVAKPVPGPQALVVALPDPDGSPSGTVVVSNSAGSVELKGARDATRISGPLAPSAPVPMENAAIEKMFGATLSALPSPAEHLQLYFLRDSDELTTEAQAVLPRILAIVKARPVPEVTVIGHTDTTGPASSNYQLGLRRAGAVARLLVATGVDAALVEVASHGESDLLVATADDAAEPRNRRVEITIR